jgi:hypothetical protein
MDEYNKRIAKDYQKVKSREYRARKRFRTPNDRINIGSDEVSRIQSVADKIHRFYDLNKKNPV